MPSDGICRLPVLSEALPTYCGYEEYSVGTYEAGACGVHISINGGVGSDEAGGRSQRTAKESLVELKEGWVLQQLVWCP